MTHACYIKCHSDVATWWHGIILVEKGANQFEHVFKNGWEPMEPAGTSSIYHPTTLPVWS